MEKLHASQILVNVANLGNVKLDSTSENVKKLISETKDKQAAILKLLDVDQEKLKMVVQL
jgi:hypothetical protein